MRKFSLVKSILFKSLSVLVILINLALVTFVWVIQNDVSSSAVTIFREVDNIAQVMRNGIARVEPKVSNLHRLIGQVEVVSEVIAENVSENGIISRLLPQTFVDNLRSSSQSLFENFNAVYDLLGTTSDILLTLEKIPFVSIPERGLSTIATLQVTMEDIADQVDTVQSNIEDVRAETSTRISQVTAAASFLGAEIEKVHTNLLQIDSDLDAIQISVRKYQRLTPPIVISSAILFSLLSGWVVYSQVVMFSRSGTHHNQIVKNDSEDQEPLLDEGKDE